MTTDNPAQIGRCPHCGAPQFDNPNADPVLDTMSHLCWKCVKPWADSTR